MLKTENKIFTNIYGDYGVSLNDSESRGDWVKTAEIIAKGSDFIISEIKNSNLTGRGGAGFPTGLKWSFLDKKSNKPRYLVINADEGEPGTCKDREIMRNEPHKLLEGIFLASFALGIHTAYIYIRGEYTEVAAAVEKAIEEAKAKGYLGKNAFDKHDLEVYVHLGAGAYICGEETALLESLEGAKAMPRSKPPFPASEGLYASPTIINNVETVAQVPEILKRGADWFTSFGKYTTKGTRLFTISGMVNNPCIFEEEIGIDLKHLIEEYGGGVIGGWNNLQAVIPGGISSPILNKVSAEAAKMDPVHLKEFGSSIGTSGIIVFNNDVDIYKIYSIITHFYMHESCGQCTPCREGSGFVYKLIEKIAQRKAKKDDILLLKHVINNINGNTICGLGDAIFMAVNGFLKNFEKKLLEEAV